MTLYGHETGGSYSILDGNDIPTIRKRGDIYLINGNVNKKPLVDFCVMCHFTLHFFLEALF